MQWGAKQEEHQQTQRKESETIQTQQKEPPTTQRNTATVTTTTIQQPPKVSHADTTNDMHTALGEYHVRMGETETVPLLVTQPQRFDSFDTTTQTGKPLTYYSMEKNAQ